MSSRFHSPTAAIGVPIYINIDLARQQVSCCLTSGSALPILHRSTLTFLSIYSRDIFNYSYQSHVTRTPRYLTVLVHLMPPTSWTSSFVSISDFFLLRRRFHLYCSAVSSSITIASSFWLLVMTSMSSANASRSPLFLTASNLVEDFRASSRYTLNSTGDSTDPYGSPISALMECYPTCMVDSLCSFMMRSTRDFSY